MGINFPEIEFSLLFCTQATGPHEEDSGTCRVSRTRSIKVTESNRTNCTNLTPRISTAKIPAYSDTLVREVKESFGTSNDNVKAGHIPSCLSKWKENTSDKWMLYTVSGTNIEFGYIIQIPLSQMLR